MLGSYRGPRTHNRHNGAKNIAVTATRASETPRHTLANAGKQQLPVLLTTLKMDAGSTTVDGEPLIRTIIPFLKR